MASSIGVDQLAMNSKLAYVNIENGFTSLSISQASPSRKSTLSARRSTSSMSTAKLTNLRYSTNRLMNLHLTPCSHTNGNSSPSSQSTEMGHRMSGEFSKRGSRLRRSVDDANLIRRSSSSQNLNIDFSQTSNNKGGDLTNETNSHSLSVRRSASAQNISQTGSISDIHSSAQRKSSANAAMAYNAELLATFESEKKQLESRISELTQLTEKRKSEIERYKIEMRQLAENLAHQVKVQTENDSVKAENRVLRDKLREISGGAFEHLTDTEKLSILQQQQPAATNGSSSSANNNAAETAPSGSGGSECGRTIHTPDHGSSCFSTDVRSTFQCGGIGTHSVSGADLWDRQSCRSGAESDAPSAGLTTFAVGNACQDEAPATDVANLRDKIAMMEETNYSTNEELQATVQELVEMQKTVNELQQENERLADERAVLLASLCAQTQKLVNCRVQIDHLKALLLSDGDSGDRSEYEQQLAELVKRGEEERDELLLRQAELSNALAASEYDLRELIDANGQMREQMTSRNLYVSQLETEKRQASEKISNLTEQLESKESELDRCRALLSKEQLAITNGVDNAIALTPTSSFADECANFETFRAEKTRMEHRIADVEERLNLANRELSRVRDQLSTAQTATLDLESRLAVVTRERASFEQELLATQQQLDQMSRAAESAQADMTALRIRLDGALRRTSELESELNEVKRRHTEDCEEWRQFQRDLQMAVVVANNMCVETKENLDRITEENSALQDQHRQLSQDRARLLEENNRLRSSVQQSTAERDLAAAASMQRFRASGSGSSNTPNTQLSVKSLIRSIEAQVKTGAPPANNNAATAAAVAAAALLSSHHHSVGGSPRRGISVDASSRGSHTNSPSGNASPASVISTSRASPATHSVSNSETPTSTSSTVRPTLRKNTGVSLTVDTTNSPGSTSATASSSSGAMVTPRPSNNSTSKSAPLSSTPTAVSNSDGDSGASNAQNGNVTSSSARLASRMVIGDFTNKDPLTMLAKQMGGSKRNALLKWVQNRTQGYGRIEVTNFSSSWADGLVFCALMHSYLPDSVPYNQLAVDTDGSISDRHRNFNVAFKAAESVGIPRMLDIEEMVATERPDWQRIMAYVTAIYKCFELPEVAAVQAQPN